MSPSASVACSVILICDGVAGLLASNSTFWLLATGASSTGVISTVIVAGWLSSEPSLATKVKLSGPLTFEKGYHLITENHTIQLSDNLFIRDFIETSDEKIQNYISDIVLQHISPKDPPSKIILYS